ncbi:Alpha/Beta hydrolase protein [Xylariaceae sp. FL1019]|nr:Alpha/Beta hydrolase protein [Xylariaceae sp. FL1019]
MVPANRIYSPRASLVPFLTAKEAAALPYPPNAIPGARDVETFYGTMRVYEWGPENGDKVIFVHGDATPSPIFSKIAQGLVDSGHRVMLFDLWGRGYSDTPLDCRHDVRLFETQILLALASSSVSWTGSDSRFSIIRFSLGGPIALAFAGVFPELVHSVVLFGPAGLLQRLPKGYDDQLIRHPETAPSKEAIREKVRQILGLTPSPTPDVQLSEDWSLPFESSVYRVEQNFDLGAILQWQFDHHLGHVYSFQDTIRYGPARGMEDAWATACDIIAGRTRSDCPLHNSNLLVLFGEDDVDVVGTETTEQILELLPPDHLQTQYIPGDHGFPYPNSEMITKILVSFWNPTRSML